MSLTNLLLQKSTTDREYGLLIRDKLLGEHWKGRIEFEPTAEEIDIYIFDLEIEISEQQREFYRELQRRYFEFSEDIADLLHKSYINSIGYLEREEIWEKFKLTGLTFPLLKNLNADSFFWDLYYSYEPNKPSFVVEMKNWQPEECHSGE